jgi:excisionase family DNA binding protein
MVNYYTLEEAARLLGMPPEELRKLADRNEIRAFRDRGNLRFRSQDIEERARQLGRGSDPDLQPGDAVRPRPTDSPQPRKGPAEVFDFELSSDEGEQVDLGSLVRPEGPSSKKGGSSKRGAASPPPKGSSDSDVRLVPSGSNVDFEISTDSDVKMVQEPPPPARKSALKRKTSAHVDPQQDSSVRIVPLEGDSDVKMTPEAAEESDVLLGAAGPRSASDSDIRLVQEPSSARKIGSGKSKVEPPVTEEIDLDAELQKAGGSSASRSGPRSKSQVKPQPPNLPTSSPFELSQSDVDIQKPGPAGKKVGADSSSDFDLTPMGKDDSSPLSLDADEEVTLGELSGRRGDSGINLQDPADSGISLEQTGSSDEIEIELGLDAGATPKPAKPGEVDSSNEFELSLDAGGTPAPSKAGAVEDSDSEFELSLDADEPAAAAGESDSEFELTLDGEGGLAPLEGEESSEERDIFETDFEVPALDEESGSQAVALDEQDTDLASSDFDLALGEEDAAAEDESHSQVVAIEEEEEEAEAVVRPRRRRLLEEEEEVEDEEEERPGRAAVAAAPAQWGVMPALVMFPCVVVMFLVGLMAFELVHGMWGYHQPYRVSNLIIRPIAEMFTDELPPNK